MAQSADGLVHWADRVVPVSGIRLAFTVLAKNGVFLATIHASVPEFRKLAKPIGRLFTDLNADDITLWAISQTDKINEELELDPFLIEYLRAELAHLMDKREPTDMVPVPPAPETASPQREITPSFGPSELMTSEDLWNPVKGLPLREIVTLLAVRKAPEGFVCQIVVKSGPYSFEQFTAVPRVLDVLDFLRSYHRAKAVVARLRIIEPDAYGFVRRWNEKFGDAIRQYHDLVSELQQRK